MKKFYLGLVALLIVLGISGCSGDSPSDVAVEFVQSISDLDSKEAKSLASKKVQNQIQALKKLCIRPEAQKILKLTEKEMPSFIENNKDKIQAIKDKIVSENQNISQDESIKMLVDKVKDLIDDSNIKSDEVKKAVKLFMDKSLNHERVNENQLITNMLISDGHGLTKECIAKNSYYSNLDKINIIETSDDSADKSTVRLELIYDDENSRKVSLGLEKIQDEWKVTNPSFNINIWDL